MSKGSVLILGARSDIGMAAAHRFAKEGYAVQLAARNVNTLETDRSDIALRHGAEVTLHEFDALDTQSHSNFVTSLPELPIIALSAIGYMGDQSESEQNSEAAATVIRSNFEGPASILGILANKFEERGSGSIIGISSVAGERGRASNYIYGSAKAGFTAFLSGLRNRLASKGVHVLTVQPGFVATKMTAGLDLPPALTGTPEGLAEAIFRAEKKQKNILFYKGRWRLIMFIITHLPESIFKRTQL